MNDLGFWMAMFVLGALAYFETPLGRLVRAGLRTLWNLVMPDRTGEAEDAPQHQLRRRRPTPIRRANGQLAGSFPSGNVVEPRSRERSATERDGTNVTTVPIVPLSIPEMLFIAARLGQGMAPNEVAKSLPGYSGRKYPGYVEKVRHVKAILDEQGALVPVVTTPDEA